jgi:hypothetical protein
MLSTPMDKVGSMQKQMVNVNKEMEIPRKTPKEMLEIINVTEMKHAFNWFISRQEMTEKRIYLLKDIVQSFILKGNEKKRLFKKFGISKTHKRCTTLITTIITHVHFSGNIK